MVIQLFFLLFSALAWTQNESPFVFKLELSKAKVFQGEQVTANFVLEAPHEISVDIEVMKFPEFRGFWSENLVLRQGPVHLMTVPGKNRKAAALIGSYSLSSIMGIQEPRLEPMRILVKSFGSSPVILKSEGSFPSPSVLPEVPKHFKGIPFSGAVGNFSLEPLQNPIPFRKNQPFLIRLGLQGSGNFAEVNTLPVSWPQSLSLVSQNSFLEPQSGRSRKVFEWILNSDEDSVPNLPSSSFLIFEPATAKYQRLEFPPFNFVKLKEISVSPNLIKMNSIDFSPDDKWTSRSKLSDSDWIVWVQALLALGVASKIVFIQIRERRIRLQTDPRLKRKKLIKQASLALRHRHWASFLELASQLSRELLTDKNSSIPPESLTALIEADNQLRYSPLKKFTISEEVLKNHWDQVQRSL